MQILSWAEAEVQTIMQILSSTEFWKISFPALAAVVAWFFNERSKLKWEQYKRKEEHYKELIRCLRGFYVTTQDMELKKQFLDQLNLLWLYAPDNVLQTAYAFLETVETGASASDENDAARKCACGALVAAVRRDLLARTVVAKSTLSARDFRHFTST